MVKMIVSDLDGTLLNIFHTTDKTIVKAIDSALEAGVVMVVATGRSLNDQGKSLGLSDKRLYLISNNGAVIRNPQGEVLYQQSLSKDFVKRTLEQFPEIAFDCIGIEKTWINTSKEVYINSFKAEKLLNRIAFKVGKKRFNKYFIQPKHFDTPIEEILKQDIIKMNCRIDNVELSQRFSKYLSQEESIVNLPFSHRMFEITDKEVNKANATRFLAQKLNINQEDIVVFGDGGNDYPLISEFKHSYAPKNANSKVKEAASEVLGHYWFHSVPKKIMELIKKDK